MEGAEGMDVHVPVVPATPYMRTSIIDALYVRESDRVKVNALYIDT